MQDQGRDTKITAPLRDVLASDRRLTDKWRATPANWREGLTVSERHLLSFAILYQGHFAETLAENGRLSLIAKLADLLDGRPVEVLRPDCITVNVRALADR